MKMLLAANILEVFGFDWRSLLFYIGNFVLLAAVLIAVLYKPVKKMLESKRKSLDDAFAENDRLRAESENSKAEYDKIGEDMKVENARVAAEVAKAAEKRADELIGEAQEQARAIVDAAKKEAVTQKEQLRTEYRDSVNRLAVQVAQKVLEREVSEKDNAALIEQALSDWEDAD